GKAPLDQVLASVGRARVEAGALDRAINAVYAQVMKAEDLVPVSMPNLTLDQYNAPEEQAALDHKVAKFSVEVDLLPEVELKGYEKLKIKPVKHEPVTEKDLEEVYHYLKKQQATMKELAVDAVAVKGMWAELEYEGKVDGVIREEMKSAHHPIVIGEGNLIPGFEEHLVGMKALESKTFPITFPKDYQAKHLQGKKAEFQVKILDLKDIVLPQLDEKFAASFGHKTVAELEKAIKASLERERDEAAKVEEEEHVLEELLKYCKFELPASLIEREKARLTEETNKRMEKIRKYRAVMDAKEKAAGESENLPDDNDWTSEMRQDLEVQAEKSVRIGLALGKVIELNQIEHGENATREALNYLLELARRNA
ncbi:MAG: trigger factor, partial [Methanothrix sp.]